MRSRRDPKPIVGAVVAALAGAAIAGCGGGHIHSAPPAAGAAPSTNEAGPASVAAVAARTVRLQYTGGRLGGDTGRAEVALGSTVAVVVTSDIAGEIHLHGYDRSVDVPAGGTATLTFTADIPGVFEVEMHGLGRQLVQLQVS